MGPVFKNGHFKKCPIFKMRLLNLQKKMKNPFLLDVALNTKKIRQKLLPYFFYYFNLVLCGVGIYSSFIKYY